MLTNKKGYDKLQEIDRIIFNPKEGKHKWSIMYLYLV